MKIGYTYSNLRIFNAHVLAEDSSKLFRVTLKVVQVLEFNYFRHKTEINPNKHGNVTPQHLCCAPTLPIKTGPSQAYD